MKFSIALLLGSFGTTLISCDACPFANSANEMPSDSTHNSLRGRRRLASLSEDETTREKLASIIAKQKRALQNEEEEEPCFSNTDFENIRTTLGEMTDAINNAGDRGHFIGMIVRLAAHDFMDFDLNADASDQLGSDGCLDFSHDANAGLPDLWCDDALLCPMKALYDDVYASRMSRADFWVASANAVIQNASPNQSLVLPFKWGRIDREECLNSSSRLPEPGGCNDVEDAFITRMGLTWTDAVALLGAHTLGRGDENNSGHPGTWVQDNNESTIFDKQFYSEVLNRGWRRRETNAADDDWTWGGNNRGVMMLNTDICLRYDIEDGAPCCTNTNQNCRDDSVQNIQCADSDSVRPEAFDAFNRFEAGNGNDNDEFFAAFTTAWVQATENGYDSLLELVTCGEDETVAPTSPPNGSCNDADSVTTKKGEKDCAWVLDKMKCGKFSDVCPVTCDTCT